LVENKSADDMEDFIPKSSFYDIYREFYFKKQEKLNKIVNYALEFLFSNIKIRLLTAKLLNPELFSHVTLYLDGHDTRGMEIGKNKSDYYSYKLKKPGFRTQVAIDINNMIIFVSDSKPCKHNTDDKMLLEMNIDKKLNDLECIALDGGYSNSVKYMIENTNLNAYNFLFPIRKQINVDLNNNEIDYNLKFGGFRSKIEKIFADIGDNFKRLNNEKPIKTSDIKVFNIQYKIGCLLLNIKNFVELSNIEIQNEHQKWLHNDFDFPSSSYNDNINDYIVDIIPTIKEKINNSNTLKALQDQFLGLRINEDINLIKNNNMEINENENESYEIENILDHKGIIVEDSYYFVKWKNFTDDHNSWVHYNNFNTFDIINSYWNNK
jgi:hypothetical protein